MEYVPSYEGLAETIRAAKAIWHAADPYWMGEAPENSTVLEIPDGVVYFSPPDLVISAGGGTHLSALQEVASHAGLWLPIGEIPLGSYDPSLSEAIGLALPHLLEAKHGTWREWILGMTVVLGDGTIAKSGCRAVKSVAGYDAHKLFVGARGTLGVIAEVTLRLFPGNGKGHVLRGTEGDPRPEGGWICRALRSDFPAVLSEASGPVLCTDSETGTIWGHGIPPPMPKEGWIVRSACSTRIPGETSQDHPESAWIKRAKVALDPENKLNLGRLEGTQ